MHSQQKGRDPTPQSYRLIHSGHRESAHSRPAAEYFPIHRHPLANSRASSQKDTSLSSQSLAKDTHLSRAAKEENGHLSREVKRLKKEVERWEKSCLQHQDKLASNLKLEQELAETYRVISFYDSKVRELENTCRQYEQQFDQPLSRGERRAKVSQLLEQERRQNVELRVQISSLQRQLREVDVNLGNLELKKVQLQQTIKQLRKEKSLRPPGLKFVDDYQQQHLLGSKPMKLPVKKKLALSKQRKINPATSGESSGEESGGQQYKSSLYLRKSKDRSQKEGRPSDQSSKNIIKASLLGNFNSKINQVQKELQSLRKQNQRLHNELDGKVDELVDAKKSNQKLQIKIGKMKKDKEIQSKQSQKHHKLVISKDLVKEIPKPNSANQNKLSLFVSNVRSAPVEPNKPSPVDKPQTERVREKVEERAREKGEEEKGRGERGRDKGQGYQLAAVKKVTITKILTSIVKSELTHEELLGVVAGCWSREGESLQEQLQSYGCELNEAEVGQFEEERAKVLSYISSQEGEEARKDLAEEEYRKELEQSIQKTLRGAIPHFKNITFRRQFAINIRLANKFKNYEEEFEQLAETHANEMPLSIFEEVSGRWGFSFEEFLCMLAKSGEEGEGVELVGWKRLGKFYLQN